MIEVEVRMESAQSTVAVNLGTFRQKVEERVKAGAYASTDEVIQAGLLALEREEAGLNESVNQLAEDALSDPRPRIPAAQVFQELRAKYGRPSGDRTF